MIETTHEHCATCEWLGREAERTATAEGRCHWMSQVVTHGGTKHTAHYTKEATR